MGKVSAIITCYQQAQYLIDALDSILNQTYKDWECIVVDNASNDNTQKIIEKYTKSDKRFRFIQLSKNEGVSYARNSGFQEANGEFIQFLDGDDYLMPTKFENQVSFLKKNAEIDVCYSTVYHLYEQSKKTSKFKHTPLSNPLSDILFNWDYSTGLTIHNALMRRNIWKKNELPFPPDYNYRYEDWIFWVLIALKKKNFHFLDVDSAYYRIHTTNFVSKPQESLLHYTKAIQYIYKLLPQEIMDEFYNLNMKRAFEKYAIYKIEKDIYSSFTWKLAKLITKPIIFLIPQFLKRKLQFQYK